MGLFDSIQNLIGGFGESAQNQAGDIVGGLTDNQNIQDAQEQVTTFTEGAGEAMSSAMEQGQTLVDDITQNLGL